MTWRARCRKRVAAWRLQHRYPAGRMTQEQLERWAEDAIAAQAPDRVEHLERQMEHLTMAVRMVSTMLTTSAEILATSTLDDIRCPVCGCRYSSTNLRDHIANPPDNCDRFAWDNGAYPRALLEA